MSVVPASPVLHDDLPLPTSQKAAGDDGGTSGAASPAGPASPMRERSAGLVGLLNQGATCYLNSLLQALFMTPAVRKHILQWRGPSESLIASCLQAAVDSSSSSSSSTPTPGTVPPDPSVVRLKRCVPFQLQLLFARLLLSSSRSAVSTHDLTYSFGWSDAESFRQHDVQELMRVLLAALEKDWTAQPHPTPSSSDHSHAPSAAPNASSTSSSTSSLSQLYTGKLQDILVCNKCHSRRTRTDPFQDLSLSVSGFASLDASLRAFVQPEKMDGENQLRCDSDECEGKKQDATKSLAVTSLPPILTFQLKRFLFDFQRMQRVKVNDAFDFPEILDLHEFAAHTSTDNSSTPPPSTTYELFAILMHSGVAQGGHYYAYLRSADDQWHEFNDAHVWTIRGGLNEALKYARGGAGKEGGSSAYMIMYRAIEPEELKLKQIKKQHLEQQQTVDLSVKHTAVGEQQLPVDGADVAVASLHSAQANDIALISAPIRALIHAEELQHEAALIAAEKERRTLEFQVHFHAFPMRKLVRDIDTPFVQLLKDIREAFDQPQLKDKDLKDIRLRKYDGSLNWASTPYQLPTADFGDASKIETITLSEIGFTSKHNPVLLELKAPNEEWPAYEADTIPLRIVVVSPSNVQALVSQGLHPLLTEEVIPVFVSRSSTLQALKQHLSEVASQQGLAVPPVDRMRVLLMHETYCEPLKDDSASLVSVDLFPGRFVYVENASDEEILRPVFEQIRCQIEICYNLPSTASSSDKPQQPEYTEHLSVSRNETLGVVKAKIGAALHLEPSEFRISRTHTSPQFKDESQTLAELQLVDQSGLFISLGRPLQKDEFQISFHLYQSDYQTEEMKEEKANEDAAIPDSASTSSSSSSSSSSAAAPTAAVAVPTSGLASRFQYLFDLPLSGDLLVSELKRSLLVYLSKKRPHATIPGGNGWNIRHVRLRDKKGVNSTRVLEDDKSLLDNFGSGKLCDGLELALQKLEEEEVWTKDKMMIQIQQWNPLTQKLSTPNDLVIRKNISLAGIRQQLYKLIHGQNFVSPPSTLTASASSSSIPSLPTLAAASLAVSTSSTLISSNSNPSSTSSTPAPTNGIEPSPCTTPFVPSRENSVSLEAAAESSTTSNPSDSYPATPTLLPAQPPQPAVPIRLAKGKLTGRMKKADMVKLAWISSGDHGGEGKLFRNALAMRTGELLVFQEELTPEETAALAAKKKAALLAKKEKEAAAAALAAANGHGAGGAAVDPKSSAAASAVKKPWQRSTGVSTLRRKAPSSNSVAMPAKPRVEHALKIGWEDEEKWLAEQIGAIDQAHAQAAAAAAASSISELK